MGIVIVLVIFAGIMIFLIKVAIQGHEEKKEREARDEVEKQNITKLLADKMFRTHYTGGVPHINEECDVLLKVDKSFHITPKKDYHPPKNPTKDQAKKFFQEVWDRYGVPFGTKEFWALWDEDKTFSIPLEKISNVGYEESQHITQETKDVLSKALVGGALLGPIGSIAGGLSAFKSTTQNYGMLIIQYEDDVGMKNTAVFYECDFFSRSDLRKFCNIITSARYDRLKALKGAS